MQGYYASSHVVDINMAKARRFHDAFQFFLAGVHANGFSQIAVAGVISSYELTQLR